MTSRTSHSQAVSHDFARQLDNFHNREHFYISEL